MEEKRQDFKLKYSRDGGNVLKKLKRRRVFKIKTINEKKKGHDFRIRNV